MAWPHDGVLPTGVLKVKCSTSGSFLTGSVPSIQSTEVAVTAFASWRGLEIETCGLAGTVAPELDSAWTRFSHFENVLACGAGGEGGTVVLTLSVHCTSPGLLKFGFQTATLLNSPLLTSHE